MFKDVTTVLTFPIFLPGVTALKTRTTFCESALGLLQFCIKANPGVIFLQCIGLTVTN